MCAKVLANPFGQMSGKFGGMVFSNNASGQIIRALVKGINPQTQIQLQARNAFANVSNLFRSLSSAEKTLWQEFADNYYSPRSGGNDGQFSAYNAFVALRSTTQQAFRLARDWDLSKNGFASTLTTQYVNFTAMPETPIAINLTPGLDLGDDNSVPLSIQSAQVDKNGKFAVVLQVGDGNGYDIPNITDVNGNVLGFAIYISDGNPTDNMAYGNEFSKCLGYLVPKENPDPETPYTGVLSLNLVQDTAYPIGQAKRFPLIGEYVNFTVLVMNKYGMFARLGSTEVEVKTALDLT